MKKRILQWLQRDIPFVHPASASIAESIADKQRLIMYGVLLLLLTFILSFLSSHLIRSYHEKTEKEQQIATMQSFLKNWEIKNEELQDSPMRPVKAAQLDQVQTDIIFNIQAYSLNLVSMKDEQKNKEQDGHVYTAEFTGTYENTMRCLHNFHVKDALIGMKYLNMTEKNGAVSTKITYKIYTK